ncbi:excinuclease ABC subunit A [Burkholderia sp. Ac-20379]|uniref:excinuclease ABC subunit A n=1 Tax=Burkholderia sp. Ac-20379 TaxID=2703900 RepID=UPI0019818DC9|nr:excinuclease ABC subunit A [Burkholderia sp. Ac-20379]MBN3727050.1 excinuclease ABC subunit A [Burkholderia sp. Ac-20379]
MKRRMTIAAALLLLGASQAQARNDVASYPIDAALATGAGKVDADISLYFAGQPHPAVEKQYGEFGTNKKTNAFGKSDIDACQHVFLSAVLELQARARKEGGNAVIDIKSNYKNQLSASATEFTCGSGAILAGVALTGKVVTLRK